MSTRIPWVINPDGTPGKTWNPCTGCTRVSEGCRSCYALRMLGRNLPHHSGMAPVFHADRLDKPLHWRKPRRIFVCSMSDLFHEAFTDGEIAHVLARVRFCWQHTFMLLTKRPERARRILTSYDVKELVYRHVHETEPQWPLRNLWLGVTVENQARADERIPVLLDTPAAVRFVSVEPMLGPVEHCAGVPDRLLDASGKWPWLWSDLDWLIVGGENGPGARPMQPEWALDVWRQCKAAGVPFFWKQTGAWLKRNFSETVGERGYVMDGEWLRNWGHMVATREFPAVQP